MTDEGSQFHFLPDDYLELIRAEVPDYDRLQALVAEATAGRRVTTVLDLGSGLGTTARAVLERHPAARLLGLDESPAMLEHARAALPAADLRVARLQDPLPEGPFDLVVSALAVHHLDGPGKADLFARVAAVLAPGGRFVLADVVVPEDPTDAVTPLEAGYDQPSRVDEQLAWLRAAGLRPEVVWASRDLAIVVADARGTST
ncbi:MAG TPA: class I SAM-dependent methyltransferase [Acidimicrobiales bacterium]|nr:class I SAM-dependent methyltransferase [Acidimicrobiales bacterium]